MKTNVARARKTLSPSSTDRAIPRVHMALAWTGFGLALLALGLDVLAICRACSVGTDLHLFVAAAGSGAYLLLALAGTLRFASIFYAGVFMAGAVHTALVAWMATISLFCPPCIASAAVAFLLMALSIASRKVDLGLAEMAFLPTVLAASGASFAAIAAEGTREARRQDDARRFQAARTHPEPDARGTSLAITVFETSECGYCREFHESYLPRLQEDFGARVQVAFVPAREAAWVRKTPTIVVEGGPTFEGLPLAYQDLEEAVSVALGANRR